MLTSSALNKAIVTIVADLSSVSEEALKVILALMNRVIEVLYPKLSSTVPTQVKL
jgi:hypothetical protein